MRFWEIIITSPQTYDDNTWHHIAGVRNNESSQQFTLYVDGEEVASSSLTNEQRYCGEGVYIGRELTSSGGSTAYFNGEIDGVRTYNIALTEQEINNLISGTTSACNTGADQPPCDGCVDGQEVVTYIDRWFISSSDVSMIQLVRALEAWKEGGC
jgi:hypothetical protein